MTTVVLTLYRAMDVFGSSSSALILGGLLAMPALAILPPV